MATSFQPKNTIADPAVLPPASLPRPITKGEWWFRLTAPQEPAHATFAQREAVRRGRLASLTIVFISLYAMTPIPVAGANIGFLVTQLITLLINAFALFVLNRRGYLAAAGWFVVVTLDLGFALAFLAIPQGVSLVLLPAFDLMVAAPLVVVAFFRPRSVFIVTVINILFIVGWIGFGPHTHDVALLLHSTPYIIFYPSIALHIFLAIILFLWVNSATKAIANLDRSEEIVALERREIEQQEQQLKLKQQLEDGIEKILQTQVRAANGDFTARAPLNKENVLWQIAYSLNNLLARLQRMAELQGQMNRTEDAVKMLTAYVRSAKEHKQPLRPLQRTGTIIDELIVELMTTQGHSEQPEVARLRPALDMRAQSTTLQKPPATPKQ